MNCAASSRAGIARLPAGVPRCVSRAARAAKHWCQSISGIAPPSGVDQPPAWEYLLLDESTYRDNPGGSFAALLPLMRQTRDRVIAEQFRDDSLFA